MGSALTTTGMIAQEIASGLHGRVWRLGQQSTGPARGLVFIADGGAVLETEDGDHGLEGPVFVWLNQPAGTRLVVEAGTTGYVAEVAEDILTRAIGDFAESGILRFMVDRDLNLMSPAASANIQGIEASFAAIIGELRTPQNGSGMLIVSHLRIILVGMMRLAGAEEPQRGTTGSGAWFLQRFRQLVESNFRSHWSVAHYAGLLGISHDRLHAICQRELGRTPKTLVAERLAREAGLGLERSTLSIAQLAYSLGFRDPAHFSHFFKRMTGMPPGRYRRMMVSSASGSLHMAPANFADWP